MLNKKIILIAGYSRGGTNLLWNILQSHPDIASPIYETGTILRKHKPLKFSKIINLLKKAGILHTAFVYRLIDTYLYRLKLSNRKNIPIINMSGKMNCIKKISFLKRLFA